MSEPQDNPHRSRNRRWRYIILIVGWIAFVFFWIARRLRPGASPQPRRPVRTAARIGHPHPPDIPTKTATKINPEPGEIKSGLIFSIVFGWFVFVFIGLAVLMHVNDATPQLPRPPPETSFPAPRLDTEPNALLAPYLAAQQKALTKTAAIPIARAMAQIASRPDPYAPIAVGAPNAH
ncbi:MAG: hypothetical protein ACREHV_02370 [Rhizomicrobium sp.]